MKNELSFSKSQQHIAPFISNIKTSLLSSMGSPARDKTSAVMFWALDSMRRLMEVYRVMIGAEVSNPITPENFEFQVKINKIKSKTKVHL